MFARAMSNAIEPVTNSNGPLEILEDTNWQKIFRWTDSDTS